MPAGREHDLVHVVRDRSARPRRRAADAARAARGSSASSRASGRSLAADPRPGGLGVDLDRTVSACSPSARRIRWVSTAPPPSASTRGHARAARPRASAPPPVTEALLAERLEQLGIVCRAVRSSSRSRSTNRRSSRSATCAPSVVLPAPMKPISARCRSSACATGFAPGTRCQAPTKSATRVAAELLAGRAGQLEGDRGLGHDGQRLDRGDVAALDERLSRLAGLEVDRAERPHQRRQRLHRGARDHLLAVRDAALDPAGEVRLPVERAVLVGEDLVVRLPSRVARRARSRRRSRRPSPPGSPSGRRRGGRRAAPPCVAYEPSPGGTPRAAHLDDAADGVALGPRLVDPRARAPRVTTRPSTSIAISREQRLRHGAGRDRDRGLPRARALERVARVRSPYLSDARRGRRGRAAAASPASSPCRRLAFRRPRAHPPRPVRVIAVADDERERRAERAPVPQARPAPRPRPAPAAAAGCGRSPADVARGRRRSPPGRARARPAARRGSRRARARATRRRS